MKLLKWSNYIMLAMTVILLGLTVWSSATGVKVFSNVWVVFLLAAFVALQTICLFSRKPKLSVYRIGFYVMHAGIVLFLIGSFIYYVSGDKLTVAIPVEPGKQYSRIKRSEEVAGKDMFVDLGFDIGVSDFKVEKYEPDERGYQADRYYEATLVITDAKTRKTSEVALTVNNPYRKNGWKIYLMSHYNQSLLNILFKKDPGEYVSLSGIWTMIIGSCMMCFTRHRMGDAK
ncbi:MAG TPA: cytochrome c biogenesis protein ResB [Clostridiales bacterium]|nr:cytochrome c biogenesis protein ResB [Clostridiales bacterium]